jgi:hypothetical protein
MYQLVDQFPDGPQHLAFMFKVQQINYTAHIKTCSHVGTASLQQTELFGVNDNSSVVFHISKRLSDLVASGEWVPSAVIDPDPYIY